MRRWLRRAMRAHGQGLDVGRQQRQQVARRRTLLAVEQGVGPLDVVVHRQHGPEAGQHQALGVGLEGPVAPIVLDQGLGVGGPAELLIGGGQGHGPFGGGRLGGEPVGDLSGRQARGLDIAFGPGLAVGPARPALQVAARLIHLGEGQAVAHGVRGGPFDDLAGDRLGHARFRRCGRGSRSAGLGGGQALAHSLDVVGGRRHGARGRAQPTGAARCPPPRFARRRSPSGPRRRPPPSKPGSK